MDRGGGEAKRRAKTPKVKRSGLYTKRTFGVSDKARRRKSAKPSPMRLSDCPTPP
jgi:hypothetical protein